MLSYCVIALIFQAILKGVSIMFKKLFFALILGISVTVSVIPSVEASSMNVNAEMETRIAKMRNIGSVQIINCADEADVKAAVSFIENDDRVVLCKITEINGATLVRFARVK